MLFNMIWRTIVTKIDVLEVGLLLYRQENSCPLVRRHGLWFQKRKTITGHRCKHSDFGGGERFET